MALNAFSGIEHEDPECPEDDTCECEHVGAINSAMATALRVAEVYPTPPTAEEPTSNLDDEEITDGAGGY